MSLRTRTAVLIACLTTLTVVATVFVTITNARQALLDQTEADGRLLVRQFINSLASGNQFQSTAEASIGQYMVLHAKTVAHLVSIAEAAGLKPDDINAHLRDIAGDTPLEFRVTDDKGHAYLHNKAEDFTFSADASDPFRDFLPLLTAPQQVVIQKAQPRPADQQVYKYVGVAGVDKPRIVQVGYRSAAVNLLQEPAWLGQVFDTWVSPGAVNAIWVLDRDLKPLAYKALPGLSVAQNPSQNDTAFLQTAVEHQQMLSLMDGDTLKVAAPITDASNQVTGAVLVYMPTDRLQQVISDARAQGVGMVVVVVVLSVLVAVGLTQQVTKPLRKMITAAREVEAGTFDPESINALALRTDELGQLSRVFQKMAREVYAREQALKQQVQELRIEIDEARRVRQVAEVTETDYFQDLQKKAKELRQKSEGSGA